MPISFPRRRPRPAAPLALVAVAALGGCASDPAPVLLEDIPPATVVDARPAAFIDGMSVPWGALRPTLGEIAGADALREEVLDRRIAAAFAERGFTLTGGAEAAERRRLLESLDADDTDRAIRMLDEIRRQERLGPHRFRMLMRRNAMLRAMIEDAVEVDEALLASVFDARHGPKRQARLLVVPTLDDALEVAAALEAGARFADLATERSTDTSAPRGGLLEPMARLDASYPEALRSAVFALDAPGARSGPIRLDRGYALVRLEAELPASGRGRDEPEVAAEILRIARARRERVLMDRLANELLQGAVVRPIDEHLEFAWKAARPR